MHEKLLWCFCSCRCLWALQNHLTISVLHCAPQLKPCPGGWCGPLWNETYRARCGLGWSSVLPQFCIRCQEVFVSWWIWNSITEINHNDAAGYKKISAVADKPWYITMMNGFINAFLNKKNIFWVTQSCYWSKWSPSSASFCSKSYLRRQNQSH